MIVGLCKVYYRLRTPDSSDPWSKCWNDLPHSPRTYSECEDLISYYEENWGTLYSYQIGTASRWGAPKPLMPGAA